VRLQSELGYLRRHLPYTCTTSPTLLPASGGGKGEGGEAIRHLSSINTIQRRVSSYTALKYIQFCESKGEVYHTNTNSKAERCSSISIAFFCDLNHWHWFARQNARMYPPRGTTRGYQPTRYLDQGRGTRSTAQYYQVRFVPSYYCTCRDTYQVP